MSGLLFLKTDDFYIQQASKGGTILCTSIRGISVILFYSTSCDYCKKLIPIFKRLPGQIGGAQFGMANVSIDQLIVKMSRDTIAPIKYVPLIILYVNGRPFIRFDGDMNEESIKQFVYDVGNKIQAQSRERALDERKSGKKSNSDDDIPPYTIGKPLYGQEDVTYLEFSEAYEAPSSSSRTK